MPFQHTEFEGLFIYEPTVFRDSRGYFFESFNENTFREQKIALTFVQDNQSSSSYGVIRGLHFQLNPHAQTKLVRVLYGSILDVVLDLRRESASYSKWFSVELSADNKKQLFIPRGFAHGFSVLSEKAEVLYKCDEFYDKECEAGIRYNDAALDIDWKVPSDKVVVSSKDQGLPSFAECRNNF